MSQCQRCWSLRAAGMTGKCESCHIHELTAERDSLRAEVKRMTPEQPPAPKATMRQVCKWTLNAPKWYGDSWVTDCDETFLFLDGGPAEFKMNYCCYCGKLMESVVLND